MSDKVLVIGTYLAEGVDSFDWWQQLPNISEYDTIVLDTTKILYFMENTGRLEHVNDNIYAVDDDKEIYKQISANLNLVRNKLTEKLEFESTIYALYSPRIIINYHPFHVDGSGNGYLGSIGTNDWCPISIKVIQETGKFIRVIDTSYQDYFKGFKEWQYYFERKSLGFPYIQHYYDDKWTVWFKLNPIAVNKVERPIAIEVCFLFYGQPKPQKIGGRLVLLPVANQYDTNTSISFLLQRGKQFEAIPPPSWINKIEIPGEALLEEDVENKKQQLTAIESEVQESERSLAEFIKHKGILYETGITLQELVKTTLEKLGAGIEPSTVTDEFVINIAGKKALVEVKGNTKSISKRDLGQLITDLGEHLKATDEDIGGILIGNAWRLEPLEARDTHDKPVFSQAVVKIAENRSIGLISTIELFTAHSQSLENPAAKKEILNKIIGGAGIIKI